MKPDILFNSIVAFAFIAAPALADSPRLQTPAPVIYLADNLDEQDDLGWCIDTLGRGFAERLQAHSCKPEGGDVQFSFDAKTGNIQSVAFSDYCMSHQPNDESTFALVSCDITATDQQFVYDPESRAIRTSDDETTCVSAGQHSQSAGPYMSRALVLTDCVTTPEALKEWVILE
ncbi:ricin-type beta-trefoil lectin domain protein [Ruegeria atlantica]|uniref:ricin-type beta-trefoil lectin domain protein n=1 Tax=Ruegeria atlantica TaxID=81569 RepID=UPI0024954EAE|nr:ricin-type beta-trefoil lectin domain protein [Ruegeria atlantica]